MIRTIVVGADHGGFRLKEYIKEHLKGEACEVADVGTYGEASSDYPDYADAVAEYIGKHKGAVGILVCRTGAGMAMAANRHKSIRAALLYSVSAARLAREHENANVAALGADMFTRKENIAFLDEFLSTEFTSEERYRRRIGKIS